MIFLHTHTLGGWSWSAVQNFDLIAQDSTKYFQSKKNRIFPLFYKNILGILTKSGRDIAWGEGHLVRKYYLK